MGSETKIAWAHHTFNPWRGCEKISPGCANCYAATMSKRNPAVLGEWGPKGKRAMAAEAYWRLPEQWNRAAHDAGERRRVFCASLADVFEDRPELVVPRAWLFDLMAVTSGLDYLLLTKRPENIIPLWPGTSSRSFAMVNVKGHLVFPNIWLGTSVEDRARKDRIDVLRQIPAAVRFLSLEPLLEDLGELDLTGISWVIVGGESGAKARPFDVRWAFAVVDQCRAAGVPVFVKQLGAYPILDPRFVRPGATRRLYDRAGADPEEWPEDLRVQQYPRLVMGEWA